MSATSEIDFGGVDESGGFERIPDGDYHAYVFDVEYRATRNDDDMYIYTLKVADGKCKGMTIQYMLPIMPKVLWRIKQFLSACGFEVPDGKMEVDWEEPIGSQIGMRVTTRKGDTQEFANVQRVWELSGATRSSSKDDNDPWATNSDEEGDDQPTDHDEDEKKPAAPRKKATAKKRSKSKAKDTGGDADDPWADMGDNPF